MRAFLRNQPPPPRGSGRFYPHFLMNNMSDTPTRTIRHPSLQAHDAEPVPPVEPALEDCCATGCAPCIFDVYEEAMERYRTQLAAWKARQAAHG
jgi:hypothetical protein